MPTAILMGEMFLSTWMASHLFLSKLLLVSCWASVGVASSSRLSLWKLGSALISLGVGTLFMFGAWVLLKQVLTLSQDNTFHTEKVVGYTADVYLRIPADTRKSGKIMVSHEGSMHELQAFNTSGEEIPTGAKVRVVATIDDAAVLVEKVIDTSQQIVD